MIRFSAQIGTFRHQNGQEEEQQTDNSFRERQEEVEEVEEKMCGAMKNENGKVS